MKHVFDMLLTDPMPGALDAARRWARAPSVWYPSRSTVKHLRRRPDYRALASKEGERRGQLDRQVSEIQQLIGKLQKKRGQPRSTPLSRVRSTPYPGIVPAPSSPARPPEDIESRLIPICERLEGLLDQMDARLAGGGASPVSVDPRCTLSGLLRESVLPDVLQMITSNAWTGVFIVEGGITECRLYFDDGQVCHAEGPGLTGESAFFAALALMEGRYRFLEGESAPGQTITSNTQFLILEALRQIDESKA